MLYCEQRRGERRGEAPLRTDSVVSDGYGRGHGHWNIHGYGRRHGQGNIHGYGRRHGHGSIHGRLTSRALVDDSRVTARFFTSSASLWQPMATNGNRNVAAHRAVLHEQRPVGARVPQLGSWGEAVRRRSFGELGSDGAREALRAAAVRHQPKEVAKVEPAKLGSRQSRACRIGESPK